MTMSGSAFSLWLVMGLKALWRRKYLQVDRAGSPGHFIVWAVPGKGRSGFLEV